MKTRLALLLCILLLAPVVSSCGGRAEDPGYAVQWADSTLEAAVRKELQRDEGETIYSGELKNIQLIVISRDVIQFNNGALHKHDYHDPVETLDDLIHFIGLRSLALTGTKLSDLSAVAQLSDLQQLLLYYNTEITDLSVISQLPKLVVLALHDNTGLTDFDQVRAAEGLVELDLHRNGFREARLAGAFSKVNILKLDHSGIGDITEISQMTKLRELHLCGEMIEDLSPLASLENLYRLDLSNNAVSDLSPLQTLANLQVLNLSRNRIDNVRPLEALSKLEELDLSDNEIGDPFILGSLENLKRLDLTGNPVVRSDVEYLQNKLSKCNIIWE